MWRRRILFYLLAFLNRTPNNSTQRIIIVEQVFKLLHMRKLIQLLEQMLTSANSMLRPCAYAAHLYERHGSQNILIVDPLTGEVLRAGLNCSSMSSCQKCMGLEIYSALANVNYHVEPMADNHIVLYCIVLCCIILYCIVLYCIVLYCIASSWFSVVQSNIDILN